ncbi:hypothetical protein ABI59_04520 [Acidobacteria bacterium Mor1]|nr:hypothetical protein ABI59_04520 [Acidobacteria bacterium Mor1]
MSPELVTLSVPDDREGERLDHFLVEQLDGCTRSTLRRWIEQGRIKVDGAPPSKPGLALRPGMSIEVERPEEEPEHPVAESIDLDVLHEDEHLLVILKPAGMIVHPARGVPGGTVVNALLGRGTPLAPAGGLARPGIVHRLDQGTSGLLCVAKTDEAYHGMTKAFAAREVHKIYQALVWGHPDPESGTIDRAIGRSRTDPTRMAVRGSRTRKAALSQYRTLRAMPSFALLEVTPVTGRTHQIRVHLQSINHSIVGDDRYGGMAWRSLQDPAKRRAVRDFNRLGLHAANLAFRHPVEDTELEFHAPLPADFAALVELLSTQR